MIVVCAAFWLASSASLRFRPDGSFKIVQFADLHFGEGEDVNWGPEQDSKSTSVMKSVILAESPDLVIFSGDQLTGNNIRDNATAYWSQVVAVCADFNIPWAIVFGNHDDAALEVSSQVSSTTHRVELMAFDQTFPLSLSRAGPANVTGVSNYDLDIWGPLGEEYAPWARLYLFDSGGGSLPEVVDQTQADWYTQSSTSAASRWGPLSAASWTSLVFVHIPLPEYSSVFTSSSCVGTISDDGVTPVAAPSPLIAALVMETSPPTAPTARAVFVGHDHGNDWCCPYQQSNSSSSSRIELCFGRHSGYGGYGDWARGARVVQLQRITQEDQEEETMEKKSSSSSGSMVVKSWIRMEDGSVAAEIQL